MHNVEIEQKSIVNYCYVYCILWSCDHIDVNKVRIS